MDEKDLVFSVYIIVGPNGPVPVFKQQKDTNMLELEMIANMLNESLMRSKMGHIVKRPEQPTPPPTQRVPNIDDSPRDAR